MDEEGEGALLLLSLVVVGDEKDRRKGDVGGEERGVVEVGRRGEEGVGVGGVVVVLVRPATALVRGLAALPCCLSLAVLASRPLPAPTCVLVFSTSFLFFSISFFFSFFFLAATTASGFSSAASLIWLYSSISSESRPAGFPFWKAFYTFLRLGIVVVVVVVVVW